jgi:hypothetical protein
MQWDLGLQGRGLLVAISLGFGVLAQLIAGKRTTRWLWLITSAAAFAGGLLTSEVWFDRATDEELQPNIDGLSFDEALLGARSRGSWPCSSPVRHPEAVGRARRPSSRE